MRKRILVVDDSATVRLMIRQTLGDAGFEVSEACDGEEALAVFNTGKFHLLITDLNMPKLDGIALVKEIRRNPEHRFVPIIMLTTESDERKKREGKGVGTSGWIVKPFRPAQLLGVVRMLLV